MVLIEHNGVMAENRDPRASEFTSQDRRRLRRALPQAQSVRLFRRLQAVLRVAEGASVAAAANGAAGGRSNVHRWGKRYPQGPRRERFGRAPPPRPAPPADGPGEGLLAPSFA